MKSWPLLGVAVVAAILLLAHEFVGWVWLSFAGTPHSSSVLYIALAIAALSFPLAALGAHGSLHPVTRAFYFVASLWLGFVNFFFWAALGCIVTAGFAHLLHVPLHRPLLAELFYGAAILISLAGLLNAQRIHVRQVIVKLEHLPETWRGRRALLLSDVHLGHINGPRFARRLAKLANQLEPAIVFLPGDLFDGVKVDPARWAAPLARIKAHLGVYFSTGNHDVYGGAEAYRRALGLLGIRVLDNECRTVEGMQIAAISYDANFPIQMQKMLDGFALDHAKPSILLSHVPNRLPQIEQAGVSLLLSGHTHGGQIVPFTWITRRIFGRHTSGLSRFGSLQVYTSTGVGTWGPPMRIGSSSEVVMLHFV